MTDATDYTTLPQMIKEWKNGEYDHPKHNSIVEAHECVKCKWIALAAQWDCIYSRKGYANGNG